MKSSGKYLFQQYMPILEWLPNYKKQYLRNDLIAGLTVGIMLIPQGMAYAMLAGLDPIHGLYASTIPLILYAIFASSRQLAVGPVAIVSLLTAAGIASLQPDSTAEFLLYAVTLALLVGIIQLGMGLLKLGFISNFLSHPVISGFTSAAAIIIGLSQLRHLLGVDMPGSDQIQVIFYHLYLNLGDIHGATFFLGLLGILIIKGSKKIHPALPGSLLAVVLGILVVTFSDLKDNGVSILGSVPEGLPELMMPSFDTSVWLALLPIALTISLVGFAESYAVAKTVQSKRKDYQLNSNQELIGLGMANLGASVLKGFPVTGGFSRTAVNDQAGAKTALASIISALLIILTLLFLTPLFTNLPTAILAAVIIVAVIGLVNIKTPVELWKKDRSDFWLLIATFLITLTGGIETGIIAGFVLSIILVVYKASKPNIARLGRIQGTHIFRNLERFPELEEREDLLMVRMDGPFYYANVDYVKGKIDGWITEKGSPLNKIVFDCQTITSIDSTAAHALIDWITDWHKAGYVVYICGAKGPVRDALERWKIIEKIGLDYCFLSNEYVMAMIEGDIDDEDKKKTDDYTFQSNLPNKNRET